MKLILGSSWSSLRDKAFVHVEITSEAATATQTSKTLAVLICKVDRHRMLYQSDFDVGKERLKQGKRALHSWTYLSFPRGKWAYFGAVGGRSQSLPHVKQCHPPRGHLHPDRALNLELRVDIEKS